MGFLSNLLKQAEAQVNPWDNGQTAATVRQQQQRPQAAQLPAPGQRPPTNRANREYNSGAEQLQMPHLSNPIPSLHNFATKSFAQLNPLDGGRTWKHAAPTNDASLIQQATHNGATNVVGGMAKFVPQTAANFSNTFANLGDRAAGLQGQSIQHNFNDPLSRGIVKMSGATGTNKQLAGDAIQVGASMIPGAGKAVSNVASKAGLKVAGASLPILGKAVNRGITYAGDAAAGAGTGAIFGGASALANEPHAGIKDVLRGGLEGAKYGAVLGGAAPILGDAVKVGKSVRAAGKGNTGPLKSLLMAPQNPHPDISPEKLSAISRVYNARTGGPQAEIRPGDTQIYNSVVKQKGYDPADATGAGHILNQMAGYEAKKQAVNGGYVQDPFRAAMDKSKQLVGQYERVANQGEQLANQVDQAHNIARKGNGTSSEQMALGKFMDQRLGLKSLDDSGHIQISRDGQPDAYYNKLGALSDKMKATQGTPAWNKHALAADKLMMKQDHIDGNTPLPVETPPQIPKTNQAGSPGVRGVVQKLAKPFKSDAGYGLGADDGSLVPHIRDAAKKLTGKASTVPEVVYHGSNTDYPAGVRQKLHDANIFGDATYVAQTEAGARAYAGKKGNVTPYSVQGLKPEDIYHVTDKASFQKILQGAEQAYPGEPSTTAIPKYVTSQGYKAIATDPKFAGRGELAIFDKSVLKPQAGGKQSTGLSDEAAPTKLPGEQAGGIASSKGTLPRSKQSGLALSIPGNSGLGVNDELRELMNDQPHNLGNMNTDSYASTFGVSKDKAASEIAGIGKPKTKAIPKQKPAPLTAAENTAKNPVKVDIPKVDTGNFEQARINPQLASHPVQYATGQVLDATKKLGLTTSQFGRMVEGTDKPANEAQAAAVQAYRDLADRVHATSQSLGGNTAYVNNYFRHEWDLSNPEDAAKFDEMVQKMPTSRKSDNPYAFEGVDHQPRVFSTIAQGEAAGFKLKNQNLADEVRQYGQGSAHALRQQALSKALTEADMGAETKPNTFDLGGGKNLLLSDKGMREAKGYAKNMATDNPLVKGYRTGNRGFKQMLLSVSQFHPVNISVLRAGPTLTAEGHMLRGGKGIFDTFAAQAVPGYSHKLQTAALQDGTIEASARLGTPIKFGSDYKTEGQIGFGKGGFGEKAIFERAMPAMHIQMVKSAIEDLKEEGLSLDSKEAHALGTRINEIMGFVNTEVRNLDKGTQRRLGDVFLAPQFTRAKWATNKSAVTEGGIAGSYARRSVAANAAAAAVVAMGVGYALHQKSDNINDMLLRAVFHPSVPTPLKDKKGNTIELGLPATQSSEVLGLLGFSLKRGTDAHLHVDWKPGNVPTNVANYGRSRLAILPATGLKVATNTDYAGKPLYDPQADIKTKLEQGTATVGTGLLPIGGQGIAQTKIVKDHLPQGVQQVLNANTPGANPLLKSIGSSFGLTPKTDKTVGKGLQTTQYFDALNKAKSGLNANDLAAWNAIHPQSKNPVSGTYQTNPTIYDSQQRAATYLKNPNVLAADNKLNQQLAKDGQQIDPFFKLDSKQQEIANNYAALAQGDTRRSSFLKAYPFLNQLSADRNAFFSSLPAGNNTDASGNSRPELPDGLQYPKLNPSEQSLVDKYYSTSSPTTKKQLLNDPAMAAAVGKVKSYSAAIAAKRDIPDPKSLPGYTPPAPKNPNSKNTGNSTKTTYDPATNTWTRVSSKTGRTVKISADGTQTVVNAGTRSGGGRRTGTASSRTNALASYAKLSGSTSPMKYENSLRSIVAKTLKAPKVKGTSSKTAKVKTYKAPSVKMATNPRPRKAFA